MKKAIIGILCVLIGIVFLFIVKIPKYVELNNLIIVEKIGVKCDGGRYKLYLSEIIPLKDDTGISYKHKVYTSDEVNSLKAAYKSIAEKNSKKIFYKDTRYLVTNCVESEEIVDYFKIKPNYIEHPQEKIEKIMKKK